MSVEMAGVLVNSLRRKEKWSCSDEPSDSALDLTRLADGCSAKVLGFRCEEATYSRFEAMGIVPGVFISKKSSGLNRGPVIVLRGATQLAIAFDIARDVLVEPIE